MNRSRLLVVTGILCLATANVVAKGFIVKDGKPLAQIVVAEKPWRTVTLAAKDLQAYVKKMSGAELSIVNKPDDEFPVKIYVGESEFTKKLGINVDDLKCDSFRMVSGPDYLALVGDDFDFKPKEPWSHKHADRFRVQKEWDEISGGFYGNPMRSAHRFRNNDIDVWFHDGSGSFNAVCEFLRTLGVRWYMPGELGEVVPKMKTIPLPEIDETVVADYPLRRWFGAYFAFDPDTLMWDMRQGINSGYQTLGAGMHVHGMRLINGRKELFDLHPEYYALYGGSRNPHHACFKSEGLKREAANFARAVYDQYDEPQISLWPNDGFLHCQCERCWGIPDSDYVFGFLNEMAKELYKTHPDKLVSGGAYSSFRFPPKNIDKFSPNVLIFIAAHRPGLASEEGWKERQELMKAWSDKVGPRRLIRNSNNYYQKVMHPRCFARELREFKDVSLGDWDEVRRKSREVPGVSALEFPRKRQRRVMWQTPGIDHLNQYVNARYLWDADRNLDELLDEYYEKFYGPAKDEMKEAFEYAEANYTRKGSARFPLENQIVFVEKLMKAREKAGDGVYGKRIQLILDEMGPIEKLREKHQAELEAAERPNARLAVAKEAGSDANLESYDLIDLTTGEKPDVDTSFSVEWQGDAIVFDIKCDEPDMKNLNISKDVWGGDSVAVLIDTPSHAYYQLEVNPDGDVFDADREFHKVNKNWGSNVEVETEKGDDFWRVKLRVPVVDQKTGALDPLHFVVGDKPTKKTPWHFFVGRVRIRDRKKTAYGLSPTGGTYHSLKDFGRLEVH